MDVTNYDDLGCFFLFLFFGVVLFVIIYVGNKIIDFYDAWNWSLDEHFSILCENGCNGIGFWNATQGVQHYMKAWLVFEKEAKYHQG